jgi:hypothetical protein
MIFRDTALGLVVLVVVLGTVNEDHDVGVLLDGAGVS